MDFRAEAAEATLIALKNRPTARLHDLGISGCVQIPGGQRLNRTIEFTGLIFVGCCIACGILGFLAFKTLPFPARLLVIAVALTPATFLRKIEWLILTALLSRREENLLRLFPYLQRQAIRIEDGLTYEKMKVKAEDTGVCLFDEGRQRLLIEGSEYRYVLHRQDVISVRPVSVMAQGGARIGCYVAGRGVDMVIGIDGQGPLGLTKDLFASSRTAEALATKINRTLFGLDAPEYLANRTDVLTQERP